MLLMVIIGFEMNDHQIVEFYLNKARRHYQRKKKKRTQFQMLFFDLFNELLITPQYLQKEVFVKFLASFQELKGVKRELIGLSYLDMPKWLESRIKQRSWLVLKEERIKSSIQTRNQPDVQKRSG